MSFISGAGGGIKSIQRGETNTNTSPVNVTISSVDMSKAVVHYNGTRVGGTPLDSNFATCYLTSATNLKIQQGAVNTAAYVSWEVVEYA